MNKKEFVAAVADRAGLTRPEAERAVDAIFDTATGAISEVVHAVGSFQIPGFGKFNRKTRAARTGRDPRTGVAISIPERTTVGFTAGKGLKTGATTSRKKNAVVGALAGAVAGAVQGAAARPATTGAAKSSGGARKSTGTKSTGGKSGGTKSTAAKKGTSRSR